MIIDAHHHLWQIHRGVYDWITEDLDKIRRDYFPRDLLPHLQRTGVQKTVLVQASESITENAFLLDQTQAGDFIGAIVGWVDLTQPNIDETLDELSKIDLVKGIRPVLQGIEDTDWILRPEVIDVLRHAAEIGLKFDALITPRHLDAIDQLAKVIPELPIVVDHAAKPVIGLDKPFQTEWAEGMARLAKHPQLHAKISGLATEFGTGWNAENLAPTVATLLENYGPSRLMWGSDWPVLELEGTYEEWFACVQSLIADLPDSEKSDILGATAQRFYGITA
ncbi:amidohydrolase family protein [Falsihalocynthiibacter sp. SS001]|uniref:amidohydrolase family protein n=1 Tax=Falsihalocynthiibacter sp. SS001 TaxID=3349698 RepID=UPI0036D31BE7